MGLPAKRDSHDIDLGPIRLVATGLEFTAAPSLDEWLAVVEWLKRCNSGVQWWCGDAVNHGLNMFGESASQGFDRETWRRWSWICEKVIPSVRRKALSFTHHEVVAKLPTREQDKWLKIAEAEGLSVKELKKRIKGDDEPEDDAELCSECGRPLPKNK